MVLKIMMPTMPKNIRNDPTYTATKAALEMAVRYVAVELSEYGVSVNAAAPGAIETHGRQEHSYFFVSS